MRRVKQIAAQDGTQLGTRIQVVLAELPGQWFDQRCRGCRFVADEKPHQLINDEARRRVLLQHHAHAILPGELSPLGEDLLLADPNVILDRYAVETDASVKRALLLFPGEFDRSQISQRRRDALIESLLSAYRSGPDVGLRIHTPGAPPREQREPKTPEEREYLARVERWSVNETGYQRIQGHRLVCSRM